MTHSTQELIQILAEELKANCQGKRFLLSTRTRLNNPVIAKAIDLHQASKVFASQDFKETIHQYQREHKVSGIIWRQCRWEDMCVEFPEVHHQLIPIPGDKEILMTAKGIVMHFWDKVTKDMNFYRAGSGHQKLSNTIVEDLIRQSEWVEIDAGKGEIYLGLCWGNPQEYQYKWAYPESGCHRIIATSTIPSPIRVY